MVLYVFEKVEVGPVWIVTPAFILSGVVRGDMSQRNRESFLRDLGYEEPFDESPVEVPEGWQGGGVVNTGGNIMCRIWRTWESGDHDRDTEFEVIYDVSKDASVGIQAYTWDEGYDGYIFDHEIKIKRASEHGDSSQAELARELMLEHNR